MHIAVYVCAFVCERRESGGPHLCATRGSLYRSPGCMYGRESVSLGRVSRVNLPVLRLSQGSDIRRGSGHRWCQSVYVDDGTVSEGNTTVRVPLLPPDKGGASSCGRERGVVTDRRTPDPRVGVQSLPSLPSPLRGSGARRTPRGPLRVRPPPKVPGVPLTPRETRHYPSPLGPRRE